MLPIGGFNSKVCSGQSRRAFLQLAPSLPILLGSLGKAGAANPPASKKKVIFVWLWGAPSHLDTFDPKPNAPAKYRGPFTPIATATPGLIVSELLPRLAAMSQDYALIRSNQTYAAGHPEAGTFGLTGAAESPTPVQPNFGSIVGRHRGYGALPPFIAIGRGVVRDVVRIVEGYGGGHWGRGHDPFLVSCDPSGKVDIPSLELLEGLTPERLGDRRTLLDQIDRACIAAERENLESWQETFRTAFSLLTSPQGRAALDLSAESPKCVARYGKTSFGQSLLLARRLIEADVPYVQVNWSQYVEAMTPQCDFGWDTHIYNFELLADRHGPIFDRAFSALLQDLKERNLLDDTLVVAMGEFGRTPKITPQAARDHWPQCYFSLWAGAGVVGGRVIGASDKLGQFPATEPITPLMVGTTICDVAGVSTQSRAEMGVLPNGRVIHELF